MHTILETSGTIDALRRSLTSVAARPDVKSLFVLACDGNRYAPAALNALLRSQGLPVFGGVFPAVLHGACKYDQGSVVAGLTVEASPRVIYGLSDPNVSYLASLQRALATAPPPRTMLVFVDGLSRRISSFIQALFCLFGLEVNYLGGGAGSLSFMPGPCILSNDGAVEDAGLVVSIETDSGVGVSHGWRPVHELPGHKCRQNNCDKLCSVPLRATEVRHNTVVSLDWAPVLQEYATIVECHSGQKLTRENFFDVAKAYPFGVTRLDGDSIVRDPLYMDELAQLVCVGEVPDGAFLEVLHGNKESLFAAAQKALGQAQNRLEAIRPDTSPGALIVMDCISRALYLEDAFSNELNVLNTKGAPFIGACTIGEIANNGQRQLDFHNKTCVAALLGGA